MRIAILDYGAGNLHSLAKAIRVGQVRIEPDVSQCLQSDVMVLPGVGSFPQAAAHLADARGQLRQAIVSGFPVIGICLGMQLFFDASDEGPGAGLGIIPGRVTTLAARRVPQMGWNSIEDARDAAVTSARLTTAYYANSYVARPTDPAVVRGWSTHDGDRFPAIVRVHRAVGVQFHPEKSSAPGVRFLNALVAEGA